jgi:hypothetical protein
LYGAFWLAEKQPFMPEYIKRNVDELRHLYKNGMIVKFKIKDMESGGEIILEQKIKVTLLAVSADSKAKSLILGEHGTNKSEDGCHTCPHPCTRVEDLMKGVYLETDVTYEEFKTKKEMEDSGKTFKNFSTLRNLEYFDIVQQVGTGKNYN